MEKWFLTNKKADFSAIAEKFGITPITAKLIRNRDMTEDADIERFLHGGLKDMHDPYGMKDMAILAEIISGDIRNNRKIRVVQDYDVDGCMSGCILVKAITECGGTADYDVPDRTSEGYGINDRIVDSAIADGVSTILTCDNGIAALDVIKRAEELGLTVIVTDHHEVQYKEENGEIHYLMPPAHAVVDPKRPDCPYPYKSLCGAGIAYKTAEALYGIFGIDNNRLHELLQYAAIATVCDIVDLTDENRIIVKEGFKRLENTDNFGLAALLRRCLKEGEKISVGRVGFFIGPVINAGGRMSTSRLVMDLLFSKSADEAEAILDRLIELNEERKEATDGAVRQMRQKFAENPPEDDVIIEYDPKCHESVAGIAAGRIKDIYHRPVIVLTDSEDSGYIKGSARSIEGFDIFERILGVSDLLTRFGGHPMAAGMTLRKSDLEEFIRRMNEPPWPDKAERFKRITIDAAVHFSALSKRAVEELELIEPCGKGNRKPVFAAKDLSVERLYIMGKNRNAMRFIFNDGTDRVAGLWFGDADQVLEDIREKYGEENCQRILRGESSPVRADIVYTPKINRYNGFESIQLDISSFRW